MIDVKALREYRDAVPWTFAKTMPDSPHEYTLRTKAPGDEAFVRFAQAIRQYGYRRVYKGATYVSLDLDGWYYWTMGAPMEITRLVNRANDADPYHSALHRSDLASLPTSRLPPLQRYDLAEDHARVWDITDGKPPVEYDDCDVLYADIPWGQGHDIFQARNPEARRIAYAEFMEALNALVLSEGKPAFIVAGASHKPWLRAPYATVQSKLNGAPCVVYCYNAAASPCETTVDLLKSLAVRYSRIGDFCAGYGRAGRIFAQAGKAWTLSDNDPRCIQYIAMNAPGWKAP